MKITIAMGLMIMLVAGATPANAATRLVPSQYPTIQAAINAAVNGDEVVVANGVYTGPGNRDIDTLGKAITVRSANGSSLCIIDCQGSSTTPRRAFYIHSGEGVSTIITGFKIRNGYAKSPTTPGGASGGGIYCSGVSPKITKCVFESNTAEGGYGAGGGAIHTFNGNPLIEDCEFTDNHELWGDYGGGGAIMMRQGQATVAEGLFIGNTADGYGGACLVSDGGTGTLSGCVFVDNQTGWVGGAIMNHGGTANVLNCTFESNQASKWGGALYSEFGTVTIEGGEFHWNSVTNGGGGAIELFHANPLSSITGTLFTNNSAAAAGAISLYEMLGTAITDCQFHYNVSTGIGGGVRFYDAHGTVTDCEFIGNSAATKGGGLSTRYFNNSLDAYLIAGNNFFQGNTAPQGSGMHCESDFYATGAFFTNGSDVLVTARPMDVGLFTPGSTFECYFDDNFNQTGLVSVGLNAPPNMHIDIGGRFEGSQFDRLVVADQAALSGSLTVDLVNGFVPSTGDSFEIVNAGDIASTYSSVFLPPLPDGLFFNVELVDNNPLAGVNDTLTLHVDDLNSIMGFSILQGVPPQDITNFTDVAIGDFDGVNGDDLAITLSNGPATAGAVLVLLNDGTGAKFTPSQFSVGNDPSAIVSALLNSDGALDLAVANRGSDTVTVLSNNGAGVFAPLGAPLPVGDQPIAIAAANLDSSSQGQGTIDLLVANFGSNTITILKNLGTGFFAAPVTVASGDEPIAIDPADVENDRGPGLVDFVVANRNDETVSVYRNLGGTFAAQVFVSVGGRPVDVRAEDLNGDGRDEIVTTNEVTDPPNPNDPPIPSQIGLLHNISSGSPSFDPVALFNIGGDLKALTSVDLDFDGDIDLGVLRDDAGTSEIQVMRNDSAGDGGTVALAQSTTDAVGSGAKTIVSGNIDNVAGIDLLAPNNGGGPLAGRSQTLGIIINQTALLCPDIAPLGGGNGAVDVDDLLAIINNWGPCPACAADIAPAGGDGAVDVDDLLAIINGWGPCE